MRTIVVLVVAGLLVATIAVVASAGGLPLPQNDYNPVAPAAATVDCFGTWRVTVLLDGMLRLERSRTQHSHKFDDRATLAVVNRAFKNIPRFTNHSNTTHCIVVTERTNVTILNSAPSVRDECLVTMRVENSLASQPQVVTYRPYQKNLDKETHNLGGTYLQGSLDCYSDYNASDCFECKQPFKGCSPIAPGLLTRAGWNVYDDVASSRLTAPTEHGGWLDTATRMDDELDLYVMNYDTRHNYSAWLADLTRVLGAIALPPRSAFGVWWSREYSYSQTEFVSEVLEGYAEHGLPLDHVVLDNGWHTQPPKRDWQCTDGGGETWDTRLFPDPKNFTNWLKTSSTPQQHPLKLGVNLHLQWGISHCQARYKEFCAALGKRDAIFCDLNSTLLCGLQNEVWSKALFRILLDDLGVSFFWTDDAMQAWGCTGFATATPQLWSNAVFDSQSLKEKKRPIVLSRYGGIGNHRYGIGFSGDAFQSFSTLKYEVSTTKTASNILFTYFSHDIGGFHWGPYPPPNVSSQATGDLFLRWLQFGAFAPILRTHCSGCVRRVWLFKYYSREMATALTLRGALVPYISTQNRLGAYNRGVGLLRPMYYYNAAAEDSYSATDQYFFGESILVAPVTDPMSSSSPSPSSWPSPSIWVPPAPVASPLDAWLPWAGGESSFFVGPTSVEFAHCGPSCIPALVAAGSAIPTNGAALTTPSTMSAAAAPNAVAWLVYLPSPQQRTGRGVFYEDDGETLDYQTDAGSITKVSFSVDRSSDLTTLRLVVTPPNNTDAPYLPSTRKHLLHIRRNNTDASSVRRVTVNGNSSRVSWTVTPAPTTSAAVAREMLAPGGELIIDCGERAVTETIVVFAQWKQ